MKIIQTRDSALCPNCKAPLETLQRHEVDSSFLFARRVFLCGLAGALMAVLLLLLAKEIALPSILPRLESGDGVTALSFPLMAMILIGVALLVGAAGSGLTLRRFLQV